MTRREAARHCTDSESNRVLGVCGAAKIDCSMPKQRGSNTFASNRAQDPVTLYILVEPRSGNRLRNLTSWSTVVALLVAIRTATLPAHAGETGADQMAQATPAKVASEEALQEIVVTARYKAESQQKIPI